MSRRSIPGLIKNQGGAAALEFAIAGPVLVALLVGLGNVGLALYSGSTVRSAVQRASRLIVTNPSTTALAIENQAKTLMLNAPVYDFHVTLTSVTISGQAMKQVAWTYTYPVGAPFLPEKTFTFSSSLLMAPGT